MHNHCDRYRLSQSTVVSIAVASIVPQEAPPGSYLQARRVSCPVLRSLECVRDVNHHALFTTGGSIEFSQSCAGGSGVATLLGGGEVCARSEVSHTPIVLLPPHTM